MSTIPRWREIQKQNFTSLPLLADYLELSPQQRERLINGSHFPLNLPRRLANKILKGTLDDPILRQFVPLKEESESKLGFVSDPLKEQNARPAPKLLHKYHNRALLLCSSGCGMHCRYCFRRDFGYEKTQPGFEEELRYLRAHTELNEIILSGGDPLSLSDEALGRLITDLDQISHLRRLRIHTRFPIGIPERLDHGFLGLLQNRRLQIWLVIHTNHPDELDEEVLAALKRLPIPILSQSVLLHSINDSFATLKSLFEKLVDHGIMVYYLHQLDPASGIGHFEVPPEKGIALMEELAAHLSGYALPKYVQEIAGATSKTFLCVQNS